MATAISTSLFGDKATSFVSQDRKMLINGKWVAAAS